MRPTLLQAMAPFAMVLGLTVGGAVHAALVSVDSEFGADTITLDTDTGLEWLDWSLTANRSFDDVLSELGAGGEFEGFRFASAGEVETLWSNGDIVDITVDVVVPSEDFNPANYLPAVELIALLGFTNDNPLGILTEAMTSTPGSDAGSRVVAELNVCDVGFCPGGIPRNSALASLGPNTQGESETSAIVGHALVRDAAVIPLPGAVWLALSAVLSLGAFRRRGS